METLITYSEKRRKEMAQEKPWRPADYPQLAVNASPQTLYYAPPQTVENWGFEARHDRGSAARGGAGLGRHQRSRRGLTHTAWKIVAWAFACGLVAGIVAVIVAVFVLHLS
jgi:hypothetical protein